jgi:hypothetical protein
VAWVEFKIILGAFSTLSRSWTAAGDAEIKVGGQVQIVRIQLALVAR